MKGRFQYQKLSRSRREIRLLELLPCSHHLSKFRPACRLFHASLDTDPPFLALSYVWGDQSAKRIIIVDKRPFAVTRNLFAALTSLRETEGLVVWIDAVCINQRDEAEKSWQVALMGKLYAQSFGVLAWLGAPANDSDAVFDYLNVLGQRAEACGFHAGPEPGVRIWQAIATLPAYMDDAAQTVVTHWLDGEPVRVSKYAMQCLLQSISGEGAPHQRLPAAGLNHLFRRPWWGRVWVLQEIALPGRAYFACGSKWISRRRLRAAFNAYYALWRTLALKVQRQRALTPYEGEVFFMASHRAHVMLSMSNVYRIERFPLVALLRATCVGSVHHLQGEGYQHLESTDPRDKIFALLGLSGDQEELDALGVSPDYSKSPEEVYTATTAAMLQQNHTSLLSLCRASDTPSHLPSWVPDWSLPTCPTLQDVEPDHLTLYPAFRASGHESNCRALVSQVQRPLKLTLLATIADQVLRVGAVPRIPGTGTCIHPAHWLLELLRLSYAAAATYPSFETRLRAVVRTSHAATGYGADASLQRVDRYHDALPILSDGGVRAAVVHGAMKRDLERFFAARAGGCAAPRGDAARLVQDFMRVTPGRAPFVTGKGWLGLAAECVRQGDVVAVIGGAQVPFVLRRGGGTGTYRVVGEAYIDGIMDGEVAAWGRWEHIEMV